MKKLSALALAGATVIAGTAIAASPKTHVMNVPLPDGSVARVEYVGDVAPKVTVAPRPMGAAAAGEWGAMFPSFAGFGGMFEQMERQSQEMARQAQQMARQPAGSGSYVASYGDLPAGETSSTIVTISNNGQTCTRSTHVMSQGPGKPPKVTSNVSGRCDGEAVQPSGPTHRT